MKLFVARVKGTPRIVAIAVKIDLSIMTTGISDVKSEVKSLTFNIMRYADNMNINVPYICAAIIDEKLATII